MASPAQLSTTDPVLAEIVRDHEKRIRKLERFLFALGGALSGSGGTWWLTVVMTRR